jgi:hypothetical protein
MQHRLLVCQDAFLHFFPSKKMCELFDFKLFDFNSFFVFNCCLLFKFVLPKLKKRVQMKCPYPKNLFLTKRNISPTGRALPNRYFCLLSKSNNLESKMLNDWEKNALKQNKQWSPRKQQAQLFSCCFVVKILFKGWLVKMWVGHLKGRNFFYLSHKDVI